jgi:hypothetical protein
MTGERLYALLLLVYPKAFREEFGPEMLADFRRLHRSRCDRPLAFWYFVVCDVVRSAIRQHLERFRDGRGRVILRWLSMCLSGIATTGTVIALFGWAFRYLYHPFLESLDIGVVACGYGGCLGAGLGITQSLALRYRWRLALAWVAMSGGAAALGLFVIASFAIMRQPLGFPESGVVLGASVGVGQWMLVRVQPRYDRRWAFATVLVLAVAAVTFGAAIQSTFAGVNPLSLVPLEAPPRPYHDLLDVVLGTLQQLRTWAVIAVAFIAMTISGIVIGSLTLKPVTERHAH